MYETEIDSFLNGDVYAVVGASRNRGKYGNKVLRAYVQNQRKAYPINPSATKVEGLDAYPDLASLPETVDGISIITPPEVTEQIVQQAIDLGIKHFWMQPGAESRSAIELAEQADINLIAGGPCLLVVLGYRESE